jgi:molybdate transport system substrate-binding protein
MTNWKRTIGLVSLSAFVLAGCHHSASQTTQSKQQTVTTATQTSQNTDQEAIQKQNDSQSKRQSMSNGTSDLVVSAAVSLKDSLEQIQTSFEKEHPNIRITYNFGASGTLEQQIEQGSPTDLFLSAGEQQMQDLLSKDVIDRQEECNLLQNQLVLITPKNGAAITSLDVLNRPDIKKIAVGQPESVPAGEYAKESLTYYQDWDSLKPKLVYGKDVRQVLSYVETGNVDAGFVYKTDALTSSKVDVSVNVDEKSHDPILYPIGIVKQSKHYDDAKIFYEYLQGSEAKQIFEKYGFTTLK